MSGVLSKVELKTIDDWCTFAGFNLGTSHPKDSKIFQQALDKIFSADYENIKNPGNRIYKDDQSEGEKVIFDFSGTEFPEDTYIGIKQNMGSISCIKFSNATFKKKFHLSVNHDALPPRFIFNSTTFEGEVEFETHAKVNDAAFGDIDFSGKTNFKENADFSKAAFEGETDFSGASFDKNVNFQSRRFSAGATYTGATFKGKADFSSPDGENMIHGSMNYESCKFLSAEHRPKFNNRKFDGSVSFKKAHFLLAPDFNQVSFHHDTNFTDTEFEDISPESSTYYATLKGGMDEIHNYGESAKFWALEQRCLREDENTPTLELIISHIYDLFSEYGQSVAKPAGLLLVTSLGFWAVYTALFFIENGGFLVCGDSFIFTLKQFFRPVVTIDKLELCDETIVIWFHIAAAIQFLFNATLITLLLLAIRRRFRLRA